MPARYDFTSEEFDALLVDVINENNSTPADLLSVPGVYEVLSEYYNDDVLDRYDEVHDTGDQETKDDA